VLSWKPVLDTQAYTIYRNGSKIATSQFPAYSDTAATENTYTYYVTASNAAGESGPSNSVSIVVDKTPPSIAYSVSTAPNANGWYNKPVTITFTAQDPKVGIASCSPPTTLDKDGVNQTVTGYAMNYVSELSRTRVVLNIDQTPPTLGVPSWSENPVKRDALVTLTVPVVDHDSGVEQGEYLQGSDPGEGKGTAMSLADGQLTLPIRAAVPPGQYKFYIRAKDAAGNWSALVKTTLVVE
jgi:hypothetical protein